MGNHFDSNIVVSVCCLAYNHESFIRKCLDGFLMQKTQFSFEVLINDDYSTDGTSSIIKEYENNYPKIIKPIYQSQNKFSVEGGGMNIRYNFPRAKGKYIAMCEGDDYWTDPIKLQKQVDFLEGHSQYSYCGHKSLVLENNIFTPIEIEIKEITLTKLLNKNSLNTATLFFRKEIIDTMPVYFEKATAGDWLLQLIALKKGKGYILEDFMSVYRIHGSSVWSSLPAEEMCESGVKTLELAKFHYKDKNSLKLIDIAIFERRRRFNLISESLGKKISKRLFKILKFR